MVVSDERTRQSWVKDKQEFYGKKSLYCFATFYVSKVFQNKMLKGENK